MGNYSTKVVSFLVAAFSYFATSAQTTVTITGHVQNAQTKEKTPAVSVTLKGSGSGTTTDDRGNFKLTTTQQPPFVLVFSSVGFETQEVSVSGSSSSVEVDLKPTSI